MGYVILRLHGVVREKIGMMRGTGWVAIGGAAIALAAANDSAALPDGPGKPATVRVFLACHDSGNFRKKRMAAEGWEESVAGMVERGAKLTAADSEAIVAYLAANFGPASPVRINTAPFAEIRSVLGFTTPEARALVEHREQHGAIRSLEELRKVPGVDAAKVDARARSIAF
jgi:competence protein ComEA